MYLLNRIGVFQRWDSIDPVSFQVAQEDYSELKETIENNGGKIKEVETLNFKATGGNYSVSLINQPKENQTEIINLMALSNYNRYRKINKGLPSIKLTDNDAVLLDSLQNLFQQLRTYDRSCKMQ